jgi:hypothetical protein
MTVTVPPITKRKLHFSQIDQLDRIAKFANRRLQPKRHHGASAVGRQAA